MSLSDFYRSGTHLSGTDDVLACIGILARQFERPSSPVSIRAGLALDEDGALPFSQIEAALEKVGMRGRVINQSLKRWPATQLPAILGLDGGRALVLHGHEDGDYEVEVPGRIERMTVDRDELAELYTGKACVVQPDPTRERAAERPWQQPAKAHWFWSEVWRVRRQFGFVMLAALIINLLAFALPLFTMNVYDRIIPNRAQASLWALAVGVLLAVLLEFGLRLARTRLVDEIGRNIDARLSQRIFEKVMNLPLSARKGSTGALARRVMDYETIRDFFASTTVALAIDLVFLVLFIIMIAILAGPLALVPAVAIAVMLIAGLLLQRAMGRAAVDAQADSSLQHSVLVESIGGLETLKACRAEGQMLGRWQRFSQMSAQTQERLRQLTATAVNLASLCQQATSIGLVIGGFYLFNNGSISMGGIIAIVMLAGRSLAPVGQLAFLITRARQAFLSMESLQRLMDEPDEREMGSRSIAPVVRRGELQLDRVSFRYPDAARESLTEISLSIQPGERIGIIGRVASGKSTLGRVLCGLYAPTDGNYLIDGLDSRQHHPHELRSELRFVGQDAELFSGTIRENLLLGTRNQDDERLIEVLRESGADAFLGREAAGFDLHVGERGSSLSGGQRSFLVLARALIEPCRMLFLDEPTGAMDTQTEKLFIEKLGRAVKSDQTLIVSTHRHAMLSIVNRLIVVDQGRIVADGPRDVILSQAQGQVAGQ
jgi:ATP-binding cassette, subfamily C, bacterial LapB